VVVVEDAKALARVVPDYVPPFLVQRFEHASFLSCTGVIADRRLLALTTSRVPRLWPPVAGMHTFSETVPVPDGLADRARRLLNMLGWQGIFQFQMLESDDGRFSVIDLNPRVFASVTLDARAGANLAAVWCDWLLGGRPEPVFARPGLPLSLGGGRALPLRVAAASGAAAGRSGGPRAAPAGCARVVSGA
jgi:predicted ATP-grasp superfamily ATP-dependent carboligase